MSEQPRDLCDDISDEADLCRNEGAADIADLLDEARQEILKLRSDKDIMSGELEVLRAHAESSRKRQAHLYKESVEGATVAAAELSRLRDLVREMREALEYYADFKSNTGHDGEYIVYLGCGRYQNDDGTRASEAIAKADAILKESGEPVKYGCHCELGPGEAPDGCVIDEGRPLDCVYTRQSSKAGVARKENCEHWRPIK